MSSLFYKNPKIKKDNTGNQFIPTTLPAISTPYSVMLVLPTNGGLGLKDWLPEGLTPDDNFCGINRNIDPVRLAGNTIYSNGLDLMETLSSAIRRVVAEGGISDAIYMPTKYYDQLVNELGPFIGARPISTDCFQLYTHGSLVDVYRDEELTEDIFVLQSDTWSIGHYGLYCTRPSANARITIPRTQAVAAKTCECGASKVNSSLHSSWCPLV